MQEAGEIQTRECSPTRQDNSPRAASKLRALEPQWCYEVSLLTLLEKLTMLTCNGQNKVQVVRDTAASQGCDENEVLLVLPGLP